jgi:hypothetical protein
MRKVLFKKWIPKVVKKEMEISNYPFPTEAYEEGTNCWESDFMHEGVFHGWSVAYEEFETGAGNYTIAIVELPDGTVVEILPKNLKFVEPTLLP